jgi:hypothetical protein
VQTRANLAAPVCPQARKKSLRDAIDILPSEGSVVRQRDQAIRHRFGYRTAAPISELPALLDRGAVEHRGVDEMSPHAGHHRLTFLGVSQQHWEKMIVVSRFRPLLRKDDVLGGGELGQQS